VGRTVRSYLADRPPVRRGPSARVEGHEELLDALVIFSDRPRRGAGPSARRANWLWVPRAGGASSRVVNQAGSPPSSPNRKGPHLFPSLLLSLKKGPPLGDFVWGTPRTVRAHPQTLREVLHHVIWVFFSNKSFSFSDFGQEGG
jgi:hypothetical protein